MSGSIDIIGDFSEFLFEASIAGVPFWMIDSSDEGGRRVLRFLFPGQDIAQFQDLGEIDGAITINGLLIGDDYTAQADAMRAAYRTPGPWTLQHPWMGELQVMQAEQQPRFSNTQEQYRVTRFSATFYPYTAPVPPVPDTLQALLDALDDIQTAAADVAAVVLAAAQLTVAVIAAVQSLASTVLGVWNTVLGAADAVITAAVAAPLALLAAIDDLAPNASYPANVAVAFGGVSAAIAGTSTPLIPAAVAPGGSLTPPAPQDGRTTANLILAALPSLVAPAQAPAAAQAMAAAAQAMAVAGAVQAASDITFTSQQEASTWQQTLYAAVGAAANTAALLVATPATASAGSALWRALVNAQSALASDMNAEIGRLPPVITFTPPAPAPAWLYAQYLAGDNPSQVPAVYLDLVRRNGIVNPGAPPPGPLEVLL